MIKKPYFIITIIFLIVNSIFSELICNVKPSVFPTQIKIGEKVTISVQKRNLLIIFL